MGESKDAKSMSKDELFATRKKRAQQEINIGDKVKVYHRDGKPMYEGKVAIVIEKALLDPTEYYYGLYIDAGERTKKLNPLTREKIGETALLAPFFAQDLELVKE